MKTQFELADVVKEFWVGIHKNKKQNFTPLQVKVLNKIAICRTAALGGHEEQCNCCGKIRYSYNSCGDRHCPKCQAAKQALWVDKLINETLPIKHYHLVFTVPHDLNKICLFNQRLYYSLLFRTVWNTLRAFGYSEYGVELGAICILHTWGQNLSLHPHIHCIIPAAGYSLKGKWKHIGKNGKYLFTVKQLSAVFKGKFTDSLKRGLKKMKQLEEFEPYINQSKGKNWVVYCEPSMAKAEHVIKYLGQYTHRVAITNQRILNITDTHITFTAKNYRHKTKKSVARMEGVEFLRRFCMHILPKRFVKIRRFGIYNPTIKRNYGLQFTTEEAVDKIKPIKKETTLEKLKRLTGFDAYQCPFCKKGKMIIIREIPRIRSPGLIPFSLDSKASV